MMVSASNNDVDIITEKLLFYTTACFEALTVYSQNTPVDYQMNDKTKKEYDLLEDILNLCSVYCKCLKTWRSD